MSEFKADMQKLRQQMNIGIAEQEASYAKHNRMTFFRGVNYGGKRLADYFEQTSMPEKRVILEVLLDEPRYKIMDRFVSKLLLTMFLENKEQPKELFKGAENLLTEDIDKKLRLIAKMAKVRTFGKYSAIAGAALLMISTLSVIGYELLKEEVLVSLGLVLAFLASITISLVPASSIVALWLLFRYDSKPK